MTKQDIRDITQAVVAGLIGSEEFHQAIAKQVIYETRFNQYGVSTRSPESVNLATAVNRGAQAAVQGGGVVQLGGDA